eukprot:TRINITY_DN24837_c0_g1_i2.p1 TRINITY_DN24837_c0_g1~~TRINITY_DN24837_c0_g1_i2.p1  ORF type:complete len:117 (+),score=10.07 TRINITY_DN24837_c0_g1_i2:75-425(+)
MFASNLNAGWNSDVCDCTDDISICVKGTLCPFYLAGKNKADADGRRMTFLDMLVCPCEYWTRQQIRSKYTMGFEPCVDAFTSTVLCPCVMCQNARELQARKRVHSSEYKPSTLDME